MEETNDYNSLTLLDFLFAVTSFLVGVTHRIVGKQALALQEEGGLHVREYCSRF